MSLVCKTLVLVESTGLLRMVARAFPAPKYELEFVDNLDEAIAHTSREHTDMFVVDSKFASDDGIGSIKRSIPTMIVEQEYLEGGNSSGSSNPGESDGFDMFEEADKMKVAADKLLRKNYINWVVNALEYSSRGMYSDS